VDKAVQAASISGRESRDRSRIIADAIVFAIIALLSWLGKASGTALAGAHHETMLRADSGRAILAGTHVLHRSCRLLIPGCQRRRAAQVKSLRRGSAAVSEAILGLAQELLETFPGPLHLLAGIALADPRMGRRAVLDLIGVLDTAAFVGIDLNRDGDPAATPQAAARLLADLLQRERMITQPLPIFSFWLGCATSERHAGDAPVLPDVNAVQRYMQLARTGETRLPDDTPVVLADRLLAQDVGLPQHQRPAPVRRLRHALRGLVELPRRIDVGLQQQIRRSYLFRRSRPVLPADVTKRLETALLARENLLEDVDYGKIVPNDYVVELNESNYRRNYMPIERQVCERWQSRLVSVLNTTNDRWGRSAYRFCGPVRVRIRAVADLEESQVRLRCQVNPDVGANSTIAGPACLELIPGGRRWPLQKEMVTVGRDNVCDVFLDMPVVQQARLVSGQHAYIVHKAGEYHLFDGGPGGRPSVNGTFVNGQRVGPDGYNLSDGDTIILALQGLNQPRSDAPGAVAFLFRWDCR
jgi:hypothetical protein